MNDNQLIVYMQRSPVFAKLVLSVLNDAKVISDAVAAPGREKAFGMVDGEHIVIGMLAGRTAALFTLVELAESVGQGAQP